MGDFAADLADQVDPAAPRHRQVQQQQVEAALAHMGQHFESVDGFADDIDVGCAVEDALEAFAHDGVVVGNDNSNHKVSPR